MSKCSSQRFEEIVENQKQNLKYLQQLEATHGTAREREYRKFAALATGLLGEAMKSKIEKTLGDRASFESIIGGLQLIAIAKPSVLADSLLREIEKAQEFFEDERNIVLEIVQKISDLLGRLSGDWSDLDDPAAFNDKYRKQLNRFFNKRLPHALRSTVRAKTRVIEAENYVYHGNILTDPQHKALFFDTLYSAKEELEVAKGELEADEEITLIEILLELLKRWDEIKSLIDALTPVDALEFGAIQDRFSQVGGNYKRFLETLHAIVTSLTQAVTALDTVEFDMKGIWKTVHEGLVRNRDFDPGDLRMAENVFGAIDHYIETSIPQPVILNPPLYGGAVTATTIAEWESQANAFQAFKDDWTSQIEDVIGLLDNITTGEAEKTITDIDSLFAPITDAVFGGYRDVTRPIWRSVHILVTSVDSIIERIIQGRSVESTISGQLQRVRNAFWAISTALGNSVGYFQTNDPKGALEVALGLNRNTRALLNGFESLADSLGLDFLSKLLSDGDIAQALGVSPETADTLNQLLACVDQLKEGGEVMRNIGAEIQKIAVAESERKKKLQQSIEGIVQAGIENQGKEIQRRQNLLDHLNQALRGEA